MIGWQSSRHFLNQWKAKPKPIVFDRTRFPRLTQITCICFEFWLADWLFTSCVIGQRNYFGFDFTTLNWKPLYSNENRLCLTRVTLGSLFWLKNLWNSDSGSNWNLKTLDFKERGKREYPEKIPGARTRTNNKLNPYMMPRGGRRVVSSWSPYLLFIEGKICYLGFTSSANITKWFSRALYLTKWNDSWISLTTIRVPIEFRPMIKLGSFWKWKYNVGGFPCMHISHP